MHRHAAATVRLAAFVVLTVSLAGCGRSDPATPTDPEREIVEFHVVAHDDAASGTNTAEVQFALVRAGGDEPEIVHTHPLAVRRAAFDLDLTEAIGLDVVLGDTVVAPLSRAYWEANASGPIVVRIERAGVTLRRKIVGPEGCSPEARKASRCATVLDKQHLPLPLTFAGPSVLPVKVAVAKGFFDDVGAGPLVIEAIDPRDAVGDVLLQENLEASKTLQTQLTVDGVSFNEATVGDTS